MTSFLAIDFETADHGADSACAVGLVLVRDGAIVESLAHLIRPPRRLFAFTHIHGIDWPEVADAPSFGELWPRMEPMVTAADFLVAHNAPFDRGVLQACCEAAGIVAPSKRFVCTVQVARRAWKLYPTKLPDVCRHLSIQLKHHDAASDAEACARIAIAALQDGVAL